MGLEGGGIGEGGREEEGAGGGVGLWGRWCGWR